MRLDINKFRAWLKGLDQDKPLPTTEYSSDLRCPIEKWSDDVGGNVDQIYGDQVSFIQRSRVVKKVPAWWVEEFVRKVDDYFLLEEESRFYAWKHITVKQVLDIIDEIKKQGRGRA